MLMSRDGLRIAPACYGANYRMKAFWRVFDYIWPQWPRLVVIFVSAILISILFSLSFMTIIPLLKLMMGEEGLHGWADRKVCEQRYGIKFYMPDRMDFVDPNKPDIAYYLTVTRVEPDGRAYESGLRERDWIIGVGSPAVEKPANRVMSSEMLEELATAGSNEEIPIRYRRFDQKGGSEQGNLVLETGQRPFYLDSIGLNKENLRLRKHRGEELAHYAKACTDIEFNFPFGWSELEGIANRGDYDLRKHSEQSKKDLSYFDQATKEKIMPHVIEPSAGVDRTFFAVISDAFNEEEVKGRKRIVLKLKPHLAPYQVAVFPLLKKKQELVKLAKNLFYDIKNKIPALYDDTASIGKLYRRQDEVGTPFCVTVDVDSLSDNKVTVRNRDTMAQNRVSIDKVLDFIKEKLDNQ